ncbi:Uncharacterised protein [uncultured archaeon]|nr:Uncharacterised protein [uncultured archaeon]
MKSPIDVSSQVIAISKNYPEKEYGENIKNFLDLPQKNIGARRVEVKFVDKNSIFNIKPQSLLYTRFNLKYFNSEISKNKTTISLFKIKGKRDYKICEGGNNRVFFLINFPHLTNNRKSFWANIIEIDSKNADYTH